MFCGIRCELAGYVNQLIVDSKSRISGWGQTRVPPIHSFFFIRFEANLSEYGSYSVHIRMFLYIHKYQLFASFASYYLQNIRTDLLTNIWFDATEYMLQWIFTSEQIFAWDFLILVNICNTFNTFKRIFGCKYSHTSKYLFANIHIAVNICYVLLQII